MANIRVAFAQIPLLDDRCDAYRLFLAEELLDARMSPAALMKGLGFDAPAPATSVPAPAAAIRAASAPGTLAEGLFASAEGGAFLSSLETLASAVGSAALLGAIFVPTPAGVVSHGAMPGEPGLSYSFDEPAGLLRLYRDNDTGQ